MTDSLNPITAVSPAPRPWRIHRRLIGGLLGSLMVVVVLPTLISFGPARWLATALLNRQIHGRVALETVSCGWFTGLRASGLRITDAAGEPVVRQGRIEVGRTLAGLIINHRDLGTVAVHDLDLEIVTAADGTTNLERLLPAPGAGRTAPGGHGGRAAAPQVLDGLTLGLAVDGLTLHYVDRRNQNELTIEDGTAKVHVPAGSGPIGFAAQCRVAGGDAPGRIKLTGQLARDLTRPAGAAQVHAEHLPLDFASKLLNVHEGMMPVGFGGTATTDARIEVAGLDVWTATGQIRLDHLQCWGSALGPDRPQIGQVAIPFDLRGTGDGVAVQRLDLASAVASLTARGQLRLTGGAAAADRLAVEGSVDLARLGRLIPATLHLQKDVTIQTGVVGLALHASGTVQKLLAKADMSIRNLTADRQGQRLSLDQPVVVRVGLQTEGHAVQVNEAEVQSSFFQLSGGGSSLADAHLDARADLDRLRAELAKFIDLGPLELGGTSTLRLTTATQPDGGLSAQVDATLTGLHLGGVATPLDEPLAHITSQVRGRWGGGGSDHRLTITDARIELAAATATVRAAVQPAGGQAGFRFNLAGDADLARLLGQWGKLLGLAPALQVSGAAHVGLAGTFRQDTVQLASGTARLTGLRLDNPQTHRTYQDPSIDVALAGTVTTGWPGRDPGTPRSLVAAVDLSTCTVKSSTASATIRPCRLAGLGSPSPRVELTVHTSGDLEKASGLLAVLSDESAAGRRSGRWDGQLTMTSSGPAIRLACDTRLTGLSQTDDRGQVIFNDPLVLVTGLAGVELATGKLTLADVSARSDFLAVRASGTLDDWRERRALDLKGTATYDWTAMAQRLPGLLSPELKIQGRESQPFAVHGCLKGATSLEVARGLTASLTLGLGGADGYGITVGPAHAATRIGDRRIAIAPIQTVANNGQVHLSPTIDLGPEVPVLVLPPGPVLSDVEINPKLCRSLLRYVSPLFNEVTDAQGKLSLDLTRGGARVPLDRDHLAAAVLDGHLTIHAAIQTEGVVKDLMAITGQSGPVRLPISQSIQIRIVRGRLYEQGLTVPIRGDAQAIGIAGSIGFDETLDLVATIPITPRMVGNDRQLYALLKGQQIEAPIRGTLNHPALDHTALASNVRRLTRKVGRRTIERKAEEFLQGDKPEELLDRFLKRRRRTSEDDR